MRRIQTFEVSLKAFILRDDRRVLLVREADTNFWELPGGRIDVGEEWLAHDEILARELREELGPDFAATFSAIKDTWTRRRPTDGVFQVLVATHAKDPRGPISLSDEHAAMAWVSHAELADYPMPQESGYAAGLARLFTRTSGAP
jgi:8-oxo-dGTP pyrophosphatase MutT (NUDIX family)